MLNFVEDFHIYVQKILIGSFPPIMSLSGLGRKVVLVSEMSEAVLLGWEVQEALPMDLVTEHRGHGRKFQHVRPGVCGGAGPVHSHLKDEDRGDGVPRSLRRLHASRALDTAYHPYCCFRRNSRTEELRVP